MAWNPEIRVAFDEGDADKFAKLLRANPEFLRGADGRDRWMWMAAMDGKLSIVQSLVELGVGVNESKDGDKPTDPDDPFYQAEGPILQAAGQGQLHVVRWLLDHGAKINYVVNGKPRCLPLRWAATSGHLDVVKLLIEHGADIHLMWNGSNTITQAEDFGQFAVRDYLHSLGARTLRETTPPDHPRSRKRFLKEVAERCGPLADWKLEIPGDPLVTLHLVPVNELSEMQKLFTVGLSDHPLPNGGKQFACTELQCLLPADWPLTESALSDPRWNWPVEWLKRVVGELRRADRWPDEPVMFLNGDPPRPLAPDTELCGWLALLSQGESVHAPDHRWIDLHHLFPINAEEAAWIRQHGWQEFAEECQTRELPLYIDPHRPKVL